MSTPAPKPNGDSRFDDTPDPFVTLIIVDGPGDTTIRPMDPSIPRYWPRPQLPPRSKPPEPPATS